MNKNTNALDIFYIQAYNLIRNQKLTQTGGIYNE